MEEILLFWLHLYQNIWTVQFYLRGNFFFFETGIRVFNKILTSLRHFELFCRARLTKWSFFPIVWYSPSPVVLFFLFQASQIITGLNIFLVTWLLSGTMRNTFRSHHFIGSKGYSKSAWCHDLGVTIVLMSKVDWKWGSNCIKVNCVKNNKWSFAKAVQLKQELLLQ